MSQIEEDLINAVKKVFEEDIPFHQLLDLRIESVNFDEVTILLNVRDEFIGNPIHKTVHGGVISSLIDLTGGFIAFLGIQKMNTDKSLSERMEQLSKLGTIDLRVDYLRPGRGQSLKAIGRCLRTGNKIAVTRMEVLDEHNQQVALGTGTYNVS